MKRFRLLVLLLALSLVFGMAAPCKAAHGPAMIGPHNQATPLMPFLDCLVFDSQEMDIADVAGASGWQPLILDRLPEKEGIVWLRFTIAPLAPDSRPQTFLLDMGGNIPGTPVLYVPFYNELSGSREWRPNYPGARNILALPDASSEAIPCYIRLNGLPGPWFWPMIRSPRDAATNWGSLAMPGAILALCVVMLLCILRGLGERGQWRYWTALFVAVAILQALAGMPALSQGISLTYLTATLSPGIALMALPHIGRHLMQARAQSRSIDIQLFALSLLGAALAVAPLVPGWDWLYRWLDLWPLATVAFIPTALGAWIGGLPGSRRFLLACLAPPLLTAAALFGLDFGLPPNILASGPEWGVALAALLLVAAPAPAPQAAADHSEADVDQSKPKLPQLDMAPMAEPIINLEHPLDDPNLRFLKPQAMPEPLGEPFATGAASAPNTEPPLLEANPPIPSALEEREAALRKPLDELLREAAGLSNCSLPPSARQYADKITAAAHKIGGIIAGMPFKGQEPEPEDAPFNLQRILRSAHDSVAASAEYSGIALSWYMPPHLPQLYEGDGKALESTLTLLLESAVRSSQRGAVKISAKRAPNSANAGELLFTITDNGSGYPPLHRSSLALAKAWELAGRGEGYLSAECSQHGATITFSARFKPMEAEENGDCEPGIAQALLICEDREACKRLARIIGALPCALGEAFDEAETIAAQTQHPAALLIAQGRFARPAAADLIRKAVKIAREQGIKSHALALTENESEWGLLKASGFTHAMMEPVDPEILRRTVRDLAEPSKLDAPEQIPSPASELENEQPIQDKERVPTMLSEQLFPNSGGFEGPDWLGEEQAPEETQPPEAPPASGHRLEPELSHAPSDAVEWVGEPMPVTPPKPASAAQGQMAADAGREDAHQEEEAPEADAAKARPDYSAPDDAIEWVGEPTPIIKEPEEREAEPKSGGFLDFIASVRRVGSKSAKSGEENEKNAKMRDFMEGSVNLVASTLSNMLKQPHTGETEATQPAKEGAPAEEPIKARADPAVIALLERLDAAMRHANAAFAIKNTAGIAESTAMIGSDAEKFGLRLLARMAKCVEKAATAGDVGALADLLPELAMAVERNRITLAQRKPNQAPKQEA